MRHVPFSAAIGGDIGVPAGFLDALAAQSRALGFDPGVVFVPHPIQNRTAEELARIADQALEPVLRMLTSGVG